MNDLATVLAGLTLALGILAFIIWIADLPNRRDRAKGLRMSADRQAALFAELQDVLEQRQAVVRQLAVKQVPTNELPARTMHLAQDAWRVPHRYHHGKRGLRAGDHPYAAVVPFHAEVPKRWLSSV